MSDASKRKAKQKWSVEKPELDGAGRLCGVFLIEPDDEEFRRTMKNARRKLQFPMPAAIPCKTPTNSSGETYRGTGKSKTNMLGLSKLTSPREFDWKEFLSGIMKIILRRKELIHRVIFIWCTN